MLFLDCHKPFCSSLARLAPAALLAAAILPLPLAAEEAASPADALELGKASLELRLRHETVRDDAIGAREAHATTLRTVLGFASAPYRGFSFYVEAENVAILGNDLYDNAGAGSRNNGVRDRPVVADPAITELNQATIRYQNENWQLALGRQVVALDDQRFVGPVGWRQNFQSFDAFRVDGSPHEKIGLTYAFLDRVHRIFGDSQDASSHLFRAAFDILPATELKAYALFLDYRDPGGAGLSTSTFGLELAGKRSFGKRALLYEAELAEQRDAADNPRSIDAGYRFLMLGAALPRVTVKLGWEVLDGSPTAGQFRTPLATLHKFNGWADKFLVTPPNGLEDLYLQLDGKVGQIGWLVKFHDFGAETGGASYGEELDLQLLYTSPAKVTFGLKGAFYDAKAFADDTDKLMLWAAYEI